MLIAVKNPHTPLKAKGLLLLAMAYLISPVDFVPDAIPLAGILDDILVVPTAIYGVMNILPTSVRSDSENKAAHVMRRMPLIVGGVTAFITLWIFMVIYGLYSFITWLF